MLRSVYLSLLNAGQWRRKCEVDLISKPQQWTGFKQYWKLCLNLCSCKWIRTACNLVISLILLWSSQWKTSHDEGLINLRMLFFLNNKTFWVPKGRIYFVPFNYCRRKERGFEEFVSSVKKGNVISFSGSICMRFFKH